MVKILKQLLAPNPHDSLVLLLLLGNKIIFIFIHIVYLHCIIARPSCQRSGNAVWQLSVILQSNFVDCWQGVQVKCDLCLEYPHYNERYCCSQLWSKFKMIFQNLTNLQKSLQYPFDLLKFKLILQLISQKIVCLILFYSGETANGTGLKLRFYLFWWKSLIMLNPHQTRFEILRQFYNKISFHVINTILFSYILWEQCHSNTEISFCSGNPRTQT